MLNSMQHNWLHALRHGCNMTPDGLSGEYSAKRFDIYRATLQDNLRSAMADTYPVVKRLVGDRFFQAMAQRYIAQYPSQNGDIHFYGEAFAYFLREFEPARDLIYLPDMARLEWKVHQVFHAADGPVVNISRLETLTDRQLVYHTINLQPGLQLMQSEFPVQAIWRINQDGFKGDEEIDLYSGGVNLLVYREQLQIVLLPLSLTDYQFIRHVMDAKNLTVAGERTLRLDSEFDMSIMLHRLFERRLVSSFLINEDTQS